LKIKKEEVMDCERIKQRIQEDDKDKWDLKVSGGDLTFVPSRTLRLRQNGDFQAYQLSEFALTQLCQRLAIPAGYFKRLPAEMQAELASYDLGRLAEADFLLRGKGMGVRAVLSNRYVPYNNSEVIGAVESAVRSDGLLVRSFALEELGMYVKLTSTTITDDALQLKAGVMIGNSEVGSAQVTVEPFLYRKPCTNDLIVAEETAFRHRHLNFSTEKFSGHIVHGIKHALKLAREAMAAARVVDAQPVENPEREIENLSSGWKLEKRLIAAVLAAYKAEPRPTRFGVANSFTRAAQQLPLIERIGMERLAGRLLAG
jgi:hypothetical protein